jgi:hypothetical protein
MAFALLFSALARPSTAQPLSGTVPAGSFSLKDGREPVASLDGKWHFHPGDDPDGKLGWAGADFDDSDWLLIDGVGGWKDQGFPNLGGVAWYRAKVIVEDDAPLSLYIPYCYTNFEVYADGQRIGGLGEMPPRPLAYESTPVLLDLPHSTSRQSHPVAIAIRVWIPQFMTTFVSGGLDGDALIGLTPELHARVAMLDRARAWRWAGLTSVALLGEFVAIASLMLFMLRTNEKEYLWFGIAMIAYSSSGLLDTHIRFHPWSFRYHDVILTAGVAVGQFALIAFYFYLLRGARNWLFLLAVVSPTSLVLLFLADFDLLGNAFSVALLNTIATLQSVPMSIWILVLLIRRAREGAPDSRLLLVPVLLQQLGNDCANISIALAQAGWLREQPVWIDRYLQWPFPISIPALSDAVFILAILGVLIFRFSRTRRDEERFSMELESARTVQSVLIPTEIPTVPGFALSAVYKPATQVGGDLFQILPIGSGGILVVIGDVSGKGMPAAMTVSLLVGTLRTLAHYTQSPGEILAAMNQRMLARSSGGFTTCLALKIDANGSMTVANAGHIAPYLNGAELEIDNGLPLGLSAESTYAESTFQLQPDEQLTLMTDGVVEARSRSGELFGFDRVADIALGTAERIARTAQEFGQEDDITVVTLTRLTEGPRLVQLPTSHVSEEFA